MRMNNAVQHLLNPHNLPFCISFWNNLPHPSVRVSHVLIPQELNVAVEQRLKWACGANPEVQEVFDAYSTAFVGQAAALKAVSALMKAVSGAAGAVLHHESLRAHRSPEAVIN